MAPEVVKQTGHTRKADIWSVGCLVVEMFTGEHPWAQLTQMQAIFKVEELCHYDYVLRSYDLFLLFRSVPQPDRRSHQTSQLKLKTSCVKPLKLITKHGLRRWNCCNIHGLPRKALTKLAKFQGQ